MDPRLRKHLGETGQLGNSEKRSDYGSGLGHTSQKPSNQHNPMMGGGITTAASSGHLNDRMNQVPVYQQEPNQLPEPMNSPPVAPRPLPPTFMQTSQLPHVSQHLNGLGSSKRGFGSTGKKIAGLGIAAAVAYGTYLLMAGKKGDFEALSADDFLEDLS